MNGDWDTEYDLVAVGSGAGGLAAAIAAAAGGVRSLVVEKDQVLGGVTALSGGQIWIAPNRIAAARGIEDSVEDALAYMTFLGGGLGSPEHRKQYVERGDEALGVLQDAGLRLAAIPSYPDYYYPMAPGSAAEGRYLEPVPFVASQLGPWESRTIGPGVAGMAADHLSGRMTHADVITAAGDEQRLVRAVDDHAQRQERCMGSGLAANLIHVALQHRIELWSDSAAVELCGERGVEGLVVRTKAGDRRVRARGGVVLCTGGYDWRPDLVEAFESIRELFSLTPPTVTGDHFSLAARFGAAIATTLPQGTVRHIGIHIPGEEWGGRPLVRAVVPGLPHGVLVNRRGERFGDESFYRSYVSSLCQFDGRTQTFVNWPAWWVFDASYREKYPIGPIAPGARLPGGFATVAATVEQLAAQAGIDPEGLARTVDRFNGFAASGVDEDFGRGSMPWSNVAWGDPRMTPNTNLGPLNTPPFHAVPLRRVGTGIVSAGLKTSCVGQVLDTGGRPVRGLFALGNSAARLEMGAGYNSGLAIGRSLIFGVLAGTRVAAGSTP